MHAEEILAHWPETALVAEVIAVRYRNIPSPAIGFAGLEGAGRAVPAACRGASRTWPASSSATAPRRWRKPRISST